MKTSYRPLHPETNIAFFWLWSLAHRMPIPDLSQRIKPASAARKEVVYA